MVYASPVILWILAAACISAACVVTRHKVVAGFCAGIVTASAVFTTLVVLTNGFE